MSDSIGAQGTVCGGGRYDGLIDELGGQKTPSLGFGLGLERLQLLMEAQGCAYPEPEKADLFIIALGDKATGKALELAGDMRGEGFAVLMDLNQRSLRAQMKYANKLGARYTVVLGDNEVDTDRVQLKAMDTGEETEVALSTLSTDFTVSACRRSWQIWRSTAKPLTLQAFFKQEKRNNGYFNGNETNRLLRQLHRRADRAGSDRLRLGTAPAGPGQPDLY